MKKYSQKKYIMWYEVTKLKGLGLNKSQISRELNIDRGTVRKYLSMNETEFINSTCYIRKIDSKLEFYKLFILNLLDYYQDFTSSQIHDRLREHFPDFPITHRNTVNNFVVKLRREYNLPRKSESIRDCCKLPDTPYGEYAQVDFGEQWMYLGNKRSKKIYFFAIVLSRSRYKFIYHQDTPFTSRTAIYAHELAFSYLGGIPHKILYDQDKVFINSENLGDCLLTSEFKQFVNQCHFESIFCRKSDPQSKGKIENVVRYVKNNFLKGRHFSNIQQLNKESISWLERTGNGLKHNGTQLIPAEVFIDEQPHLQPYNGTPCKVIEVMTTHTIRKDNTILYRSNFYSLPKGSYKGPNSLVYSSINNTELILYNIETGKVITKHTISTEKGKLISQPEHRRKDNLSRDKIENNILSYFSDSEEVKLYMHNLKENKGRYYLDNIKYLSNNLTNYSKDELLKGIIQQINSNIYNTGYLLSSITNDRGKRDYILNPDNLQPEKRSINIYKSIL